MSKHEFRFSPRENKAHLIHWQRWGKDTFAMAKKTGKPILLSISAVWCHWCHLMDETTFSDEECIRLVNENFIPVRVDSDLRPDVSSRYALGSLPSTIFLTPEGETISGVPYIAPEKMKLLLPKIINVFQQEIKDRNNTAFKRTFSSTVVKKTDVDVNLEWEKVADFVFHSCVEQFDFEFGGFGTTIKFPYPELLRFLLNYYHLRGESRALGMATQVVNQLYSRGLFDKVEGGFFRYSETRDWSRPQYEKMLSENCELAEICLRLWLLTKEQVYLDIADATLGYIERNLTNFADGGFFNSQCAEPEYYQLNLKARREREKPFIDPVVYSGSSALGARVFFWAGLLLNKKRFILQAEKTIHSLWGRVFRKNKGFLHQIETDEQVYVLSDQVEWLSCLLTAVQTTGNRDYLRKAEELINAIVQNFSDDEHAFFDIGKENDSSGLLSIKHTPFRENCRLFRNLFLFRVLSDKPLTFPVESILKPFYANYTKYGLLASELAEALISETKPRFLMYLLLPSSQIARNEILHKAFFVFEPRLVIIPLDVEKDGDMITEKNFTTDNLPQIYLSVDGEFLPPVNSIDSAIEQMRKYQ
ncbi:thioredoxin domain-containing protein [Candidatus Sumerlaeota bacterium]|nr:thioredoxin domain-containing protein [Candidatus Sumerlaeota bacterium]